jgi:hypothetical protein
VKTLPAIIEIQGLLAKSGHSIMFPMTVAPGSPLHVTEFGDKLLKESGFYDILAENHKELVEMVKAKKPTTNYDIQKDSTEVIREMLDSDHEMAICLKKYAFNSGLDLNVLVPPAGIALRDEVMKDVRF